MFSRWVLNGFDPLGADRWAVWEKSYERRPKLCDDESSGGVTGAREVTELRLDDGLRAFCPVPRRNDLYLNERRSAA